MNNLKLAGTGLLLLLILQACKQKPKDNTYTDGWVTGSAKFGADESFQPIVDQEEYVFKALHTAAKPDIIYRPENGVIRLLLEDSVRVAILSRGLNEDEIKVLQTRNLTPVVQRFAIDAVVIIVNKTSDDTMITVNQIKKMLNGQTKSTKNIVFDNPNSSLVRYLKDLSGSKEFKPKNIFALKSNKEVIKYVSTHPDAIGITGFSWLDDPDNDNADAVNNVKVVAVKDEDNKKYATQYFKPSQQTLELQQYPLSRGLYMVNCTDRMGLGTGFAMFMNSERGQRIILASGLLPDSIPPREIELKKSFN
jgi:phosphate transport system substrate-binding protein